MADWPQWGGSDARTMSSPETGLATSFAPGKRTREDLGMDLSTAKNVRWVARLGSENYSAPVVSNGRVFIGTNDESPVDPRIKPTGGGQLRCLDETSGKEIWKLIVPRLEIDRSKVSEDFDDMNLGICSTATVKDGCAFIVTNRCEVMCLDVDGLANGNQGPFMGEDKFSLESGAAPMKFLDAKTGEVFWVQDTGEEIWASTLVADKKLYIGTRRGLVVLSADREGRELADIRLGSAIWSAVTAANGTLFVASQRNLWA